MTVAFRSDTGRTPSERKLLLDPARIGIYGFALAIAYLAGVYLGGVLLIVWYALLLLPIVSVVQAMITRRSLYVREEDSGDEPARGKVLRHTLAITNESIVPAAPIVVSLHRGLPRSGTETRNLYLWMRETRRVEQTIRCAYRGVYTVGLASVAVWDIFGLIGFTRRVSARTFTIYPRILDIPVIASGAGPDGTLVDSPASNGRTDITLLRGLRMYRPGDDARHVSWRTFAMLGEPRIREYEQGAERAITICMDTRPVEGGAERAMYLEDCVLEIAIALARYYLKNEVSVMILAGSEIVRLDPSDPQGFVRFHASTATLDFDSALSPAMVYDFQRADPSYVDSAVMFVSHTVDPGVIDFIEHSGGTHRAAAIMADPADEATPADGVGTLDGLGRTVLLVKSADALVEEFMKWQAERYH